MLGFVDPTLSENRQLDTIWNEKCRAFVSKRPKLAGNPCRDIGARTQDRQFSTTPAAAKISASIESNRAYLRTQMTRRTD
jgi:hypothetical protein